MLCIKKEKKKKSISTHVTYCGCLAEENGFTFALNYSVYGLKGRGFFSSFPFFFFFLRCYSMCFILFYVSLSECLILLCILQSYYSITVMDC